MVRMAIHAVYPGNKGTSKPNKAHPEARNGLEKYFEFYNTKRKHPTLNAKPDEAYYENLPTLKMAA